MAAKEPHSSATSSRTNPADMAKQQMDAMADVQKEFMKSLEEANQVWAARVKAETELASEYVAKMSAVRSLPESATLFQEWMTKRMGLLAQDGQRFAADMQKFMTATTRLLSQRWSGGGSN